MREANIITFYIGLRLLITLCLCLLKVALSLPLIFIRIKLNKKVRFRDWFSIFPLKRLLMRSFARMLRLLSFFRCSTFYLYSFSSSRIPQPLVSTISEDSILYPSVLLFLFDGLSQQVRAQFSSLCIDHF